MAQYIPDACKPNTVTRSFLLSLLFNVRRDKYLKLYNSYKQAKLEQSTTSGKIYQVEISSEQAAEINKFITTST